LGSKPQDYGEQETGWAVSALEISYSAIAVMLHLCSLSGAGRPAQLAPISRLVGSDPPAWHQASHEHSHLACPTPWTERDDGFPAKAFGTQ